MYPLVRVAPMWRLSECVAQLHQQYVPPSIGFDLDPYIFMDDIDSSILAEFVSSTNLSDLEDEEQKSSQ
ncbi:unnamed protein product [Phytophthora fragariaefolia]|uniref:Unnamed protein product n=1 Tax=Phytophthora fragariaefolia TaxID=1490495 RepID=A0A9W7CSV0_9STRA|nr:unnamed protein product [Phytophthora fragariaefolia]